MSWDIFAQDLPADIGSLEAVPDGFIPRSLGRRATLVERIKAVVPESNFSVLSWGKIELPNCLIEINLGDDEEVDCIAFHVYGGELAPGVITAILKALELRAIDSQTGELFSEQSARKSFEDWLAYRRRLSDNHKS